MVKYFSFQLYCHREIYLCKKKQDERLQRPGHTCASPPSTDMYSTYVQRGNSHRQPPGTSQSPNPKIGVWGTRRSRFIHLFLVVLYWNSGHIRAHGFLNRVDSSQAYRREIWRPFFPGHGKFSAYQRLTTRSEGNRNHQVLEGKATCRPQREAPKERNRTHDGWQRSPWIISSFPRNRFLWVNSENTTCCLSF